MPIVATHLVLAPGRAERFWEKVDKSGDCWLWTGALGANGYGAFATGGAPVNARAHRVAYILLRGEPDLTLELDHLCRVPLCVNPWHLEAVPHRINVRRGMNPMAKNARMTHCLRGHAFTPENTYTPPSRPTQRSCRTCVRQNPKRQADRHAWHKSRDRSAEYAQRSAALLAARKAAKAAA